MHRLVTLLLCGIWLLTMVGCDIDLTEQGQKDRALAEKINARLKARRNVFGGIIETVKYDKKEKGNYNFKFLDRDLEAQDVWDWTFRLLLIVDEQNSMVATGRSMITVTGHMGKKKVVLGRYTSGATGKMVPFTITLEGRFAGAEINEDWDPRRFKKKPAGASE